MTAKKVIVWLTSLTATARKVVRKPLEDIADFGIIDLTYLEYPFSLIYLELLTLHIDYSSVLGILLFVLGLPFKRKEDNPTVSAQAVTAACGNFPELDDVSRIIFVEALDLKSLPK